MIGGAPLFGGTPREAANSIAIVDAVDNRVDDERAGWAEIADFYCDRGGTRRARTGGVRSFVLGSIAAALASMGCAAKVDDRPPCSTTVDGFLEYDDGPTQPSLVEPRAGLRSVAAKNDEDCAAIVFSSLSSACEEISCDPNSPREALWLTICNARIGTFSIPSEATAKHTSDVCDIPILRGPDEAIGGFVEIDDFQSDRSVTGSFAANFYNHELLGSFDVFFCGSAVCQ